MVDRIEPGDVTRFNTKVPSDLEKQSQIKDYMDDNMDGFLSDDARSAFANLIEKQRSTSGGAEVELGDLDVDAEYNPETDRWE